ncbi:MFS transporter, partial [Streptomyces sp. WAC08241]|uniref:MFS transporter n=1 Tax=Streptomyces sp. WAC08241 TaxID=2487421 RepID=UPI000F7AB2DF
VLMAFAFMGGLFFVTFFLQGVQGMSPVDSGLRLLPLTGMMIVSSPLAGALITKFGPRVPLVGGMVCTAAAMFGMTTLTKDTGTFAMALWFALLGLGLAPVMVGATEVIVGNAPLELSGVAGGLQQAAMQVGGALGTAVLGAVMTSKVNAEFAGNWQDAGIPVPPDPRLEQAAEFGAVPGELAQAPGMTPELVTRIGDVIHETFMSGMGLAFTVAGIVAVVAALVAVLTKRGDNAE